MTKQDSASATSTTTQSFSPTSLQYTKKGFLPTRPPLDPTADSGYVPPFSAFSTYALPGTTSKRNEVFLTERFPLASAIDDDPEHEQCTQFKPSKRSLSIPISTGASGVTNAPTLAPFKPKRSKTLQDGKIWEGSWETKAGIVKKGGMAQFPDFPEGEEE
jgi:hypothetical protein